MNDKPDDDLHHMVGWPFVNSDVRHVGVAVSGGGDSMALLVLMQRWAGENAARISAVTVDHGLRPEAAAEAALVARVCAARGIAHETLKWRGWDGKGNLQAAARDARYRLMADWARARGVEAICLGHTRDDQAETFLMRLARKAGSDGLRGMLDRFERHGMRWVRPVLSVEREALRGFLRRQDVDWIEDPSNEDEGFDRVKARKALECLGPLGINAQVLGIVASHLEMENSLVRSAVREALEGKVTQTHGALSIARRDFVHLHVEVRRRFLNAALQWIVAGDYPPRSLAVFDMEFALIEGKAHTLAGVIAWVSKGRVWLAREYQAVKERGGNPFDNRWRIDGPLQGVEIRALGEAGLKQWPEWRDLGLPRRVLEPLPGVWRGDRLVDAPGIDGQSRHKLIFLRPSFANWLDEH